MKIKRLAILTIVLLFLTGCSTKEPVEIPAEESTVESKEEVSDTSSGSSEVAEKRSPATYNKFLTQYYGDVPEKIGKLYVFLECTRMNADATFSDRYFSYYSYDKMEDVLADYYDIMGCSYTEGMLENICNLYKDQSGNGYRSLCNTMYSHLNSDGRKDVSLAMESAGYYFETKGKDDGYRLTEYTNLTETEGSEWFVLTQDDTGKHVLSATSSLYCAKLCYREEGQADIYSYYIFFPKESYVTEDETCVVLKNEEKQCFVTATEVNDFVEKYCITSCAYPDEGIFDEFLLEDVNKWIETTNNAAKDIDEAVWYKNFLDNAEVLFPIYSEDKRGVVVSDYIGKLPNMSREDAAGNTTEYALCIQDLSVNSCK